MAVDLNFYIKELEKRGAKLPCHRCGKTNFTIIDQYSSYNLQETKQDFVIGGKRMPVVLVVCTSCGAITPHAVGEFEKIDDATINEEK